MVTGTCTRLLQQLHGFHGFCGFHAILCDPVVPDYPAKDGADTPATDNSYRIDTLLENDSKAADEYNDGADMLYDDGEISHQRPEIVRLKSRVPL